MQKHWSVESWQTMGLASLLAACSVLVSGCEAKGRGDSVSDGGDLSLDTGSATEDVAELDSDAVTEADGSGIDSDSADGSGSGSDASDDSGVDTNPAVPACSDALDCAGLACVNGQCATACSADEDCDTGYSCLSGMCLVTACTTSSDCADGNPCSSDACTAGVCERAPLFDAVPDNADDCRRIECTAGMVTYVEDITDLPPPDGIACTLEQCVAGVGPQSVPLDSLCDDGDPFNGNEICSLPDGACITLPPAAICEAPAPGYTGTEVCDGSDNNANGQVDEGCPCLIGTTQACFVGPPSARNVGGCLDGIQVCINRVAPAWGPCSGGFLPTAEVCDTKDNDCDGCADDIPGCAASLACPTEATALLQQPYSLDGPAILDTAGTNWNWSVLAPPYSAVRVVTNPTAASTGFTPDVLGDYLVSVSYTDSLGIGRSCSWTVSVRGTGLRIYMRWDTFGSVDVDLHLHRSGTTTNFCTDDDCYYGNCRTYGSGVAWGYASSPDEACGAGAGDTCYNPRIDVDTITGFDPENINIDNPNNGDSFRIMAHMFGGSARTNPVVTIYCGGRLKAVFGEAPDFVGLTRSGGSCGGETWRVADVTMLVDASTGAVDCVVEPLLGLSGGYDVRMNDATF
jgi:hypothetical protein